MLARYDDFIKQNHNCKKFANDQDMKKVFDFLSQENVIIQMIDASEAGIPALAPVAVNIEQLFTDISIPHFNTLDDSFTKQAVGLMIKKILTPFGYVVWKQKSLPKNAGAIKFKSASTYRRDPNVLSSARVSKSIWEGDRDLACTGQENILSFCTNAKRIKDSEFGELYTVCVLSTYRHHAEITKHFYSQFGGKVSEQASYMLAKIRLFSWYIRSLIGSDFSVKHPSSGVYGAAILGNGTFSDNPKLLIRLTLEFGDRPTEADKHMPVGNSYWRCDKYVLSHSLYYYLHIGSSFVTPPLNLKTSLSLL